VEGIKRRRADVKKGDVLFFGKAGCNQCHLGQNFTDSAFHNLGIGWDSTTGTFKDEGRFAVTKVDDDRGAFKTPTLRDVSLHAPYMHDGSVPTLRAAVEHYNTGGVSQSISRSKDKTSRAVDRRDWRAREIH
jgi:cytochrome c peroxidase